MTVEQYPPPGVEHRELLGLNGYHHGNYFAVVRHGADANALRPQGLSAPVYWIGTVRPLNAIDGDIYANPTQSPSDLYLPKTGGTMTGNLVGTVIQGHTLQSRLSDATKNYQRITPADDRVYTDLLSTSGTVLSRVQLNPTGSVQVGSYGTPQFLVPDGTPAAPAFSFASDPDTGFYRAADGVHVAKDGVDQGLLGAPTGWRVVSDTTLTANSVNFDQNWAADFKEIQVRAWLRSDQATTLVTTGSFQINGLAAAAHNYHLQANSSTTAPSNAQSNAAFPPIAHAGASTTANVATLLTITMPFTNSVSNNFRSGEYTTSTPGYSGATGYTTRGVFNVNTAGSPSTRITLVPASGSWVSGSRLQILGFK